MLSESGEYTVKSMRAGNSNYRQKVAAGGYDFVVLQVSRNLLKSGGSSDGGRAWAAGMSKAVIAKGGVPILFEHYMRSEKNLKQKQDKLSDLCRQAAAQSGARYSATGQAYKAVAAVKCIHFLLNVSVGDHGHAGHNGNYLFAACFYAAITGKSPVGLKAREVLSARIVKKDGEVVKDEKGNKKGNKKTERYTHVVSDEDAKLMQTKAWEQYQKGLKDIKTLKKAGAGNKAGE